MNHDLAVSGLIFNYFVPHDHEVHLPDLAAAMVTGTVEISVAADKVPEDLTAAIIGVLSLPLLKCCWYLL